MKRTGYLLVLALCGTGAQAATLEVTGALDWSRRVELGTPVSGVVAEVLVRPGDRVQRDQVLLRLEAPRFEAELARARAELKRLELARKEAQLELDRAVELYERTVISAHDLEQARIDYAAVDAQYQGARAARTQAELDLHDSVIRSPLDGVVVRREAEVGQTVVSRLQSVPLLVVAEDRQMLARARVGAAAVARFAPGQSVAVVVDSTDHAGVVHAIGLEPIAVTAGQPEYAVEVLIDIGAEAPGRLRAGQPVTLRLP